MKNTKTKHQQTPTHVINACNPKAENTTTSTRTKPRENQRARPQLTHSERTHSPPAVNPENSQRKTATTLHASGCAAGPREVGLVRPHVGCALTLCGQQRQKNRCIPHFVSLERRVGRARHAMRAWPAEQRSLPRSGREPDRGRLTQSNRCVVAGSEKAELPASARRCERGFEVGKAQGEETHSGATGTARCRGWRSGSYLRLH